MKWWLIGVKLNVHDHRANSHQARLSLCSTGLHPLHAGLWQLLSLPSDIGDPTQNNTGTEHSDWGQHGSDSGCTVPANPARSPDASLYRDLHGPSPALLSCCRSVDRYCGSLVKCVLMKHTATVAQGAICHQQRRLLGNTNHSVLVKPSACTHPCCSLP